jgi:hypothetical protein
LGDAEKRDPSQGVGVEDGEMAVVREKREAAVGEPQPIELTPEQMHEALDSRAQEAFGISGDDFLPETTLVDELAVFVATEG